MGSSPLYSRSKSEAVRIMITRLKSTSFAAAARTRTSSVALSSCAVVQYFPLPFVNNFVVSSKALARSAPLLYLRHQPPRAQKNPQFTNLKKLSDVATSQATTDGLLVAG